jgi:putative spermidine/putrescine transport system substrate-binding protein
MVEANRVTWDVYDTTPENALTLAKKGLLYPLDYSVIDNRDILPDYVAPFSVGVSIYSMVLAYRNDVFPGEKSPSSISDFWDIKKFPGRRSLENGPRDNLVFALIADGVLPSEVYPLTDEKIQRAFKKLDEIKPHVSVWWAEARDSRKIFPT